MHGFHLVIGSFLSHKWATKIVSMAQKIVTYFRSSHLPLSKLRACAAAMKIHASLKTSNVTRFTSVADMMYSVLSLRGPLQNVSTDKELVKGAVSKIIADDLFWVNLRTLSMLLEPFSQVMVAIQKKTALLADVFRY